MEEISKQVVRVERWKGQIVMARLVIQRQTACVMSIHGPQMGKNEVEKKEFRDTLERIAIVCSLWLLIASFSVGTAVLLMQCPLLLVHWYSFCRTRKDDRLSQSHLVFLQWPTGSHLRP